MHGWRCIAVGDLNDVRSDAGAVSIGGKNPVPVIVSLDDARV